ncbi:hypothetical protein K490DRAFT_35888 [Saccharata proteae CBS 121410]|uniref:GIT Spa2 homology (SHD) domain-containing protein n=1 Tax=Saccharata proteae CBS 121410 TaxID=1314787 RepID=A0A9P4HZK3_9PEZI|nr:hypothetical protein K490DRAFT_35888 [Saccharata proteae CBS 121410]
MAGRNGTLSPISVESANEWSPSSKYNNLGGSDNPYSPTPPTPRSQLITPPASVHTSSTSDSGLPNGMGRHVPSNGNPSPPSSVARSSDGAGLYAANMRDRESMSSRKALMLEDSLSEHYRVLRQYLGPYLRDEQGNLRPNKARDKLLRLSSVQFQELSTDVYDESMRRESERRRGGPNALGNDTPKFLLPKNNYHPKRNQARQKLSTLPLERFRQLATDVFYELERRFPRFTAPDIERVTSPTGSTTSSYRSGPNGRGPSGYRGPSGPGGPPYGRRPSQASSHGPPGGNGFGRPLPKTFQQNTIVPNKSTMVEDDDDPSGVSELEDDNDDAFDLEDAPRQSSRGTTQSVSRRAQTLCADKMLADLNEQIVQLQEKHDHLEAKLKEREEEIERLQTADKERDDSALTVKAELADLRINLERKVEEAQSSLEEAQNLNDSLRAELEKLRVGSAAVEQNLRAQLAEGERADGSDDDWQIRYKQLERELEEQQHVTDQVRREASQFLQEMRILSERSSGTLEKEQKLQDQVSQLESELKEWKTRYARAKTQVRSLRASTVGLNNVANDNIASFVHNADLTQPDGIVAAVHVAKFQLSIDELLQTARRSESAAVLECMKNVVSCVRNISADLTGADSPHTSISGSGAGETIDVAKRQTKLKSRVSATANNLITASKNHASAAGLAPVSLLDAAASHLTTAVVQLLKVVKIRPTPPGEYEYEAEQPATLSNKYYGMPSSVGHSRARSSINSVGSTRYSSTSSPRAWSSRRSDGPNGLLNGANVDLVKESGLEEIKNYLEDQTTDLVNSIQPLVHSIRSTPTGLPLSEQTETAIENYVNDISRIVGNIGHKTREAIESLDNAALVRHAGPVVEVLDDCREGLLQAVAEQESNKREKIPPLAFKVARATKELVLRVERIESEELTETMAVSNEF